MSPSQRIAVVVVLLSQGGLAAGCFAQRVRAVLGEPFGVAHVSLPLRADADPAFVESQAFDLADPNGRVLYPAIGTGRLGELAAEIFGVNPLPGADELHVSFLFTGVEPFEVTVFTPEPQRVQISPRRPPRRIHHLSLRAWWRAYHAQLREQKSQGHYPPLIETYLTEMLSQRLGLRSPLPSRIGEQSTSELQELIDLLFGTEDLRLATIRDTMRGVNVLAEPADVPVPDEFDWQPRQFPETATAVDVEPIAMHVPVECFYIRYGNFDNYLWLNHLKDDYGGDLRQMITLRGHDAKLDEKVQYQLALRDSAAKEFFGPRIIADVALIGRDFYAREGAALGMLFHAHDNDLLRGNFEQDRKQFFNDERPNGATLETLTIGGHEVSFLSTPDNRLRSYYAVDGDFHLVTTSRSIVERFFEAGAGTGALGSSPEFQQARSVMPLSREDTVFAYFSTAFFAGLMSPQYQVGLSRRLQRVTNDDLLQLAHLAAAAEGRPRESVQDLIDGGFLPRSFPPLEPGAKVPDQVTSSEGAVGFSPPIPDISIDAITRSEAARLNKAAEFFRSHWPQMDPLMIGVQRTALPGERMERVIIDGNLSPLVEDKYGWLLSMIGPPTDVTIASNPADVIKLQMSLQGGSRWPNIPAHHLFLGVQDLPVGGELIPPGRLQLLRVLKSTPGYLGAWPKLGLLDLLPITPPPDANGFSPLPAGLWRWQGNGFSVLSFDRDVLADASAHLQAVPSENPAQIRLRVGDLSQSQLADWITALNYSRAYEASLGNAQLLHTLSRQFRIPKAEARALAQSLLDTEFVCTLGGTYALDEQQACPFWRSTAWPQDGRAPDDYQAPLLEWFRGMSADLTKRENELILHAEIDIQRKEREPAFGLPLLKRLRQNAADQK